MNDRSACNHPDLGPIVKGHVCRHGIRWPHSCATCDDESYAVSKQKTMTTVKEITETSLKKMFEKHRSEMTRCGHSPFFDVYKELANGAARALTILEKINKK